MRDLILISVGCLILIGATIAAALWGAPQYRVYSARLAGEAALRESESSKKIAIEEARAKLESAQLLSQAEVERAKGVAEANQIIGESLKDNESYLRYLWIQNLENGDHDVIYVPTEANLPVLEAGRLNHLEKEEVE